MDKSIKSEVSFSSTLFTPFLPDEAQVNPGCYGAELAYWLAQQLAQRGIYTSYPQQEDWGWFIEYITEEGDEYLLGCSNQSGTEHSWHLFLQPQAKGLFGRNKAPLALARPLLTGIQHILDECQQITDIQWHN